MANSAHNNWSARVSNEAYVPGADLPAAKRQELAQKLTRDVQQLVNTQIFQNKIVQALGTNGQLPAGQHNVEIQIRRHEVFVRIPGQTTWVSVYDGSQPDPIDDVNRDILVKVYELCKNHWPTDHRDDLVNLNFDPLRPNEPNRPNPFQPAALNPFQDEQNNNNNAPSQMIPQREMDRINQRFDRLQDQIFDLTNELRNLKTENATIRQERDQLRDLYNREKVRSDRLENQFTNINQQFADLKAHQTQAANSLDQKLVQSINHAEQHFTQGINLLDQKLNQHNQDLIKNVRHLEEKLADMKKDLQGQINTTHEDLKTAKREILGKIDNLENALKNYKNEIKTEIQNAMAPLQTSVGQLSSQIIQLKTQLQTSSATLSDVADELQTLAHDFKDYKDALPQTLDAKLLPILHRLEEDLNAQKKSIIESLSKKIDDNEKARQQDKAALNQKLASIEQSLQLLGSLQLKINDIREKLNKVPTQETMLAKFQEIDSAINALPKQLEMHRLNLIEQLSSVQKALEKALKESNTTSEKQLKTILNQLEQISNAQNLLPLISTNLNGANEKLDKILQILTDNLNKAKINEKELEEASKEIKKLQDQLNQNKDVSKKRIEDLANKEKLFQNSLDTYEAEKKDLKKQITNLENALAKLNQDLIASKEAHTDAVGQKDALAEKAQKTIDKLKQQIDKLNRDLAAKEADAKDQANLSKEEKTKLVQDKKKLSDKIESLEGKVNQLTNALEGEKHTKEKLQKLQETRQKEKADAEKTIEQLEVHLEDKQAELAVKEKAVASYKKELAEKSNQMAEKEKALYEAQLHLTNLGDSLKHLQRQIDKKEQERKEIEYHFEKNNIKFEGVSKDLALLEKEKVKLLEKLESQLRLLKLLEQGENTVEAVHETFIPRLEELIEMEKLYKSLPKEEENVFLPQLHSLIQGQKDISFKFKNETEKKAFAFNLALLNNDITLTFDGKREGLVVTFKDIQTAQKFGLGSKTSLMIPHPEYRAKYPKAADITNHTYYEKIDKLRAKVMEKFLSSQNPQAWEYYHQDILKFIQEMNNTHAKTFEEIQQLKKMQGSVNSNMRADEMQQQINAKTQKILNDVLRKILSEKPFLVTDILFLSTLVQMNADAAKQSPVAQILAKHLRDLFSKVKLY